MGNLQIAGIVLLALIAAFALKKWPVLQYSRWVLSIVKDYIEIVLVKSKYSEVLEGIDVTRSFLAYSKCLAYSRTKSDVSSYSSSFIKDIYPEKSRAEVESLAKAIAFIFEARNELKENLSYIIDRDFHLLEVKKLTLLFIDVLGNFYNLREDLDRVHFEQITVGLNKILLLLRDGGPGKENLKKVYATTFRIYKLTKAYRSLKSSKRLTEAQFYGKLKKIFDTFLS
jgi:hypothetical protein